MDQAKYEKVIFVTGGAGFIGSNFLNKYVPLNTNTLFVNIDCLTYAGNISNVKVSEEENYTFSETDIRDKDSLGKVFETYHPTHIIHFAAESHVDMSIADPDVFILTNVVGTHNLLVLAKQYSVARFHQISTDEVYGALALGEDSFTEQSPLAPRNPYSASKASADLLVQSYYETFSLPTVITRSCNAFGPNQDHSKLIPSFFTKLMKDEKVPLYSKGEQIREWVFVEDCIDAIYTVFENGEVGETYNIGTGEEKTNLELTKSILSLAKKDESYIDYVIDRQGHDFRYSVESTKIRSQLGWSPQVPFVEGLSRVKQFYESN